jgi:curli production assembly/transport component CsgE
MYFLLAPINKHKIFFRNASKFLSFALDMYPFLHNLAGKTQMNFKNLKLLMIFLLCLTPPTFAETGVNPPPNLSTNRSLNRAEVGGLVVGQTVTMNGRAFYDGFASTWAELDEAGRFGVSVTERPTARLGSQIFVDYGNRRMVQIALPTNRSQIPAISAEIAAQVYEGILNYQVAQVFGEPDLARDEL